MVLRAIRVILATRDHKGHKESKVFRDPQVRMDIPRLKERITGRPQTNRKLLMMY
jgi:hypothetical protein